MTVVVPSLDVGRIGFGFARGGFEFEGTRGRVLGTEDAKTCCRLEVERSFVGFLPMLGSFGCFFFDVRVVRLSCVGWLLIGLGVCWVGLVCWVRWFGRF